MKLRITCIFLLFTIFVSFSNAQVTIGSGIVPVSGAILQLKQNNSLGANSFFGLGLPRVNLIKTTTLLPCADETIDGNNLTHIGLVVYNVAKVNDVCPGVYVWEGKYWSLMSPCGDVIDTQKSEWQKSFVLRQIVSADKERQRLGQTLKKSDHFVTGFYASHSNGGRIELLVESISPSVDGSMPSIVIGTPGHVNNNSKEIKLAYGLNVINTTDYTDGLIYIKYTTDQNIIPSGQVMISFTENSQHLKAPHFLYGTTTDEQFAKMLDDYPTQDVIFSSDKIIVVATRDRALNLSKIEDKAKWIDGLHQIFAAEAAISGLDNNDPNPLHHDFKAGEVRHMMVETSIASPHATTGYTAYPAGSVKRYLTYNGTFVQPWMLAHEVGHQHQQGAYLINKATESTVNLYSIAVMKYMMSLQGSDYERTPANRWEQAKNTYLNQPVENRVYDISDGELEALVGFNRDELRLMPWEQLWIIFGENFYKTLHRITREEEVIGGSEQEKRLYLITRTSAVSGYDLRGFFNQWGIRVTDDYTQFRMDTFFDEALSKGTIVPMPYSEAEMLSVTGQKKPSWVPLAMHGLTSSRPDPANDQPLDELASKEKYTDYSTSTGIFTDPRDGKQYTYKAYGNLEWFTQNLNYADERLNSSNQPISIYLSSDTEGKVYGRLYRTSTPTSLSNTWCPTGWRAATQTDWTNLYTSIKAEYNLDDKSLTSAMMAGGDRDLVVDGLWKKGANGMYATTEKAAEVGFNILPSGVFDYDKQGFESGDETGNKASFFEPNSVYYHQVFTASGTTLSRTNRNSRHFAPIRCVRAK